VFGIQQLWFTGHRVSLEASKGYRLPREERMKGYKDVTLTNEDRFFDRFGRDVVPIAVELNQSAELLTTFEHPENALYVFGPEDGGVGSVHLRHCHRFLAIPANHCLNLAAAINVVLYDRRMKRQLAGVEEILPVNDMLSESRGFIACE